MATLSLPQRLQSLPHTRSHPEARLLTWHPTGVLNDAMADAIVDFIETKEPDEALYFNRYTDFGGLSSLHLRSGHVFRIAKRRRGVAEPIKSAFVGETMV